MPLRGRAEATRHSEQSRKISEHTVARRYRAGATWESLAIAAGSNVPVIRRILADQGVAWRPKLVQLRIPEQQIAALYREGSSLRQIAATAGIHLTRVATLLHRRGVKLRGRGATRLADTERVKIPPEQMVELYLAGSTLVQITALAGSDRKSITAILKRRGVTICSRR